jgi:dTDP-glucose pyrophosphorylase/predicted transcriptional regulator
MTAKDIWLKVIIKPSDNLAKAIEVLHDGGLRIALIVDENNKLQGTLTDGDFRRALMNKFTMSSNIVKIMNKNPIVAKNTDSREIILSLMNKSSILHIPIIDSLNGEICGLETLQNITEKPLYDNPVLIMAGGFGKRLYPLTKNMPKPLLKVGNKPILETIINQFIKHGFHNFYISTHFKPQLIKDHLKSVIKQGVSIQYINEDKPLGTAGSLGLLPDNLPNLPILMMNGDLLTGVDFKHLLDFHNNNTSEVTMCIREYDFQVPYGVIEIINHKVKKIIEKPVHEFYVNAGIYVLDKAFINKVDGKSYLDMTDLLERELNNDGVINAFPIHEYWLDIGHIDEYKKANQDIDKIFNTY